MLPAYVDYGYGRIIKRVLAAHDCQVLNFESLAESNVPWPDLAAGPTNIKPEKLRPLRNRQKRAPSDVAAGLCTVYGLSCSNARYTP